MNNLDINNLSLTELNIDEQTKTSGGVAPIVWVVAGIAYGLACAYFTD